MAQRKKRFALKWLLKLLDSISQFTMEKLNTLLESPCINLQNRITKEDFTFMIL